MSDPEFDAFPDGMGVDQICWIKLKEARAAIARLEAETAALRSDLNLLVMELKGSLEQGILGYPLAVSPMYSWVKMVTAPVPPAEAKPTTIETDGV